EMRTRLFLRTTEFLWQEGHTVHETKEEAWEETVKMLNVYKQFAEEYMAMPVLIGEKTAGERFPGAVNTLCIEALMQDCKALQAGTSHFLGQNFAKASGIKFQSREGREETAWTTSWGVSTRLIGGMIMTHGDDDGMIMPPRLAPSHVVILPIIRNDTDKEKIMQYCNETAVMLRAQSYAGRPVEVVVDDRDINAGEKGWQWVKKGIPIRVEIGPRDMENGGVYVARRDKGAKEKYGQNRAEFVSAIADVLGDMQKNLFDRACAFRAENTRTIDSWDEFVTFFKDGCGGFALAHWDGTEETEQKINDELSVTIRCIPFDYEQGGSGKCVVSGRPSKGRVVFAKSY
ncbi:MAG: His/Gly/Thr/Pro-type tRNA ligase C-terminal domain-containing protein, partial [Kiritimatiellales bacterium]